MSSFDPVITTIRTLESNRSSSSPIAIAVCTSMNSSQSGSRLRSIIRSARWDETTQAPTWPLYANDRIGDCTCAAAAHMVEAWTAASRGRPVLIGERAVLHAFDLVKQVDPATGEEGAVCLDVLNLWRRR